ncbi:MOSC domain-containing protein [Nocardioides sp. cx-173]|uniref:MOSC domain-containing protein n=1 Tax=Nocardioides sp. cx-173 TaxID=2898796 RepID=UPI001E296393|nr:MOSC domain-containing protein [Nocardioides sp. cx-173]MCD4527144.1 MOSC domain-containing protein [Nocardioides sp. cx-173]UGB40499.1 MOSC domain-containing protein [Nocardioides sp. cx-173]
MALLRSLNVGRPREAAWAGIGRTSIDKQPVAGPVEIGRYGPAGDQVSDTRHHGGLEKAVYAFAREDLDLWAAELGQEIRDGQFGENLTTVGIDVNDAQIGERWRVGEAVLEVTTVRNPCNDFKTWMGRSGYDNTAWVRRFAAVGRPGPYLRVVVPGVAQAGDPVTVVHEPAHGVTVSTMFRALYTDATLLPELLRVDGLVDHARRKADAYVAHTRG